MSGYCANPACSHLIGEGGIDHFPYSDGVTCPACGARNKTDWDEDWDGEDEHMYWWISGLERMP